jgi:hypothetical protein
MATPQQQLEADLLEYENERGRGMYALGSIVRFFNAAMDNEHLYNYFTDLSPTREILIDSLTRILSKEENRARIDNRVIYTLTTGLSTLISKLKMRSSDERRNVDVATLSGLLKKLEDIKRTPYAGGRRKRTHKRSRRIRRSCRSCRKNTRRA